MHRSGVRHWPGRLACRNIDAVQNAIDALRNFNRVVVGLHSGGGTGQEAGPNTCFGAFPQLNGPHNARAIAPPTQLDAMTRDKSIGFTQTVEYHQSIGRIAYAATRPANGPRPSSQRLV